MEKKKINLFKNLSDALKPKKEKKEKKLKLTDVFKIKNKKKKY